MEKLKILENMVYFLLLHEKLNTTLLQKKEKEKDYL